ncbi:S41 family peptidase [uncultured Thomasclavelia sp.]|uniref:S41 family peptidase n=1 Tax=uncultured Thomasclavelia sp. TaxID=3025759 RepID=UPI0025F3A476|nr:S41 family peptidase [uncultured Thomasclavelia sp.]
MDYMDDFIRPNHNQIPETPKPKKKRSHIKETIFIICMIVCLGIGFVCGYITNQTVPDSFSSNDGISLIDEVYETLNDNWYNATGEDVDIQGNSIAAMVASLGDQHTEYFSQDESEAFNQSVDGNYVGIGVVQRTVSQGTMIIEIYQNSPAQKSGLEVGDIITGVDGTDVSGMSADDISTLVRGEANTAVTLTIIRQGQTQQIEVTRENIDSAVNYEIRNNNGKDYGYVQITTFGSTTADDLEKALEEFTDAHIDTLVLDLRDNGGGYLVAAQDVLSLFFNEGELMFQMEYKNGQVERYQADDSQTFNFINGYILVNGNTASASEVVAGALQEKANYKLVGDQTYGKGTAQTQKQLSDGSVLKYTYARWLLPSGTWIDGKGLTPDYSVNNVDTSGIVSKTLDNDWSYDSVSTQIASMQKMLNTLGYQCDRDDGYFSTQTVTALQQFEQANNLTVDGIYTDSDRQILEATVLIYADSDTNDYQYQKLLELIK